MKDKIRPIYFELQGYLSQAPEKGGLIFDNQLWIQYNQTIDELEKITSKKYDRYIIHPETKDFLKEPKQVIAIQVYRTILGGLISRLHGEYFSDEQPPFSGMPTTIINATQSQNQSQSVGMLLEIQERVISEIPNHKPETGERKFLEKVKSMLPSIKTGTDILSSILKIGSEFGLSPSDITKLLHF